MCLWKAKTAHRGGRIYSGTWRLNRKKNAEAISGQGNFWKKALRQSAWDLQKKICNCIQKAAVCVWFICVYMCGIIKNGENRSTGDKGVICRLGTNDGPNHVKIKSFRKPVNKRNETKGGGEELLLKFFIHMVFKTHCYKQMYSEKQLTHTASLHSSPNIMNCLYI